MTQTITELLNSGETPESIYKKALAAQKEQEEAKAKEAANSKALSDARSSLVDSMSEYFKLLAPDLSHTFSATPEDLEKMEGTLKKLLTHSANLGNYFYSKETRSETKDGVTKTSTTVNDNGKITKSEDTKKLGNAPALPAVGKKLDVDRLLRDVFNSLG